MEPLISVIVPIYNIERYLGICIESLLDQTYRNLEIILVDDGSPDRCPEICDLYAAKDSRITVIHKPNGGLVSARKAGLEASNGEYIGVVDGDDWIGRGFYMSLFSAISESGADVAIAGFTRDLFAKSQVILNTIPSGIYEGEGLTALYRQMLSCGEFHSYGVTTYLWNKLFRRGRILPCQRKVDNRITIGEDAAAVYPALLGCRKICITDNCAYHYRQREDSMLKLSEDFRREAASLRLLYRFLSDEFQPYPSEYNLIGQLDDWMLGTFIIRSGGICDPVQGLPEGFPFSADIRGRSIAVCGGGTFGQQLVRRMKASGKCRIAGWYDEDYREYRRCCMDVDPLSDIPFHRFDYIVIAKLDRASVNAYRRQLLDLGVSGDKILSIEPSAGMREKVLRLYLNDLTGDDAN